MEPFCTRLASQLAVSANMTPLFYNFDMGVKNAEFDADFESVEKVVNKIVTKSYFQERAGII